MTAVRVCSVAVRVCLVALVVAACASDTEGGTPTQGPERIAEAALSTAAFADGEVIPAAHTCDGDDVPPPLTWGDHASDVGEVVLVMTDDLAAVDPDADPVVFVHWLVAGLPASGSITAGALPPGAVEGTNDFDELGYGGPCPPADDPPHTYRFEVIGVASPSDLEPGFRVEELTAAIDGQERSSATLIGTYDR
jgi:Raf kinase inhibitor-like YbhB/YbcL family protein